MDNKIIALDCDGVLSDYNEAYGRLWEQYYGKKLPAVKPEFYYAENYYDLKWSSLEERTKFFQYFDQHGWGMMKSLPQSIEATHLLKNAGYKIIVVTSMNQAAESMRIKNLNELGFAVDLTISTGRKINGINPKKATIEKFNPEFFLDDLIENFHDIQNDTKLVLIDYHSQFEDSPNLKFKEPIKLYAQHNNLWDFVQSHIL